MVRAGHNPRDTGRVPRRDLLPLHPGLGRNLNQDRTGTAGTHLSERLEHGARYFPGPDRHPPPLGHGAHHVRLVHDFMHGPEILADCPSGNLAGNDQHGRRTGVCGGQAGGGIVKPDPRGHQGYPRFSRRAGIAVGHVGRSLFVAGRNHADARLVPQRGDDPVYLYARDPEYDFNALSYQGLDEGFAPTHYNHGFILSFHL